MEDEAAIPASLLVSLQKRNKLLLNHLTEPMANLNFLSQILSVNNLSLCVWAGRI